MNILHICAGWQKWNGAANIARMIIDEQRREGRDVSFATWASMRELRSADEVWIHCSWMPCLWWAALWGKNVHWMPECSYDPIRLRYHGWKKWLVGPIERFFLRRCAKIVATCEAEKGWVEKYLGKRCPAVEVTDVKRFFDFSRVEHVDRVESGELHLLYLGRRHPLKGVEYLEKAVAELNSNPVNPVNPVQNSSTRLNDVSSSLHVSTRSTRLKIVSSAFGEELEKVWNWCDVLVLPTLSDNFGLVIAEALERGKRVITTDGAPAWSPSASATEDKGDGNDYGGRLIYLKGYRDGTPEERIFLLKSAIENIARQV